MNISETVDNVIQYIIRMIEKAKGYIDQVIDFFNMLKDNIEALLEYIDEKIEHIQSIISELKYHEEVAA
ncbi:hypothetical protein FUA48_06855 [Flavobacterium alkalisoli]|uniref:Uncharacterized protein n=1 Tax=Flavobacterium alkalisoli TaxID=2602769 RepID=A0A5B9FT04_9FLAO|nr:hypothetical protein [Flavobacterium alkalisoli]QEE49309.1 hypothetical protein FUA48_06855 [Flavobacterium alkalisoli]